VAGRDEDMAATAWQKRLDQVWILGVVIYQQPSPELRAVGQRLQRGAGVVFGSALGRQTQTRTQVAELYVDKFRLIRIDPPDSVVRPAEAVGVFDRHHGLTDPTHAVECDRLSTVESLAKVSQIPLAPREPEEATWQVGHTRFDAWVTGSVGEHGADID